jgi:hypothetical protein
MVWTDRIDLGMAQERPKAKGHLGGKKSPLFTVSMCESKGTNGYVRLL